MVWSQFPKRCNSFTVQGRLVLHSARHAMEQRLRRNRSTIAYGGSVCNRNHWNTLFEVRVVIGDFKDEHITLCDLCSSVDRENLAGNERRRIGC